MLQDPSEVVRDEDGIETCAESRVDVGAGAVADHPSVAGLATVVGGEGEISLVMLLGENLDCGKVGGKAGAVKLVGLLFGVSFSDED